MSGWRTVVIQDRVKLFLRDDHLVTEMNGEETEIPLDQIGQLLIMSPKASLTVPLLNALADRHALVTVCDEKRDPSCVIMETGRHVYTAGCLMDQAAWRPERAERIWTEIVSQKMRMQHELTALMGLKPPDEMHAYREALMPGDSTNREGQMARLYFGVLFGPDFVRHMDDEINAALNYGYAIVRSSVTRAILMRGYHPALGLHHRGRTNPVNLSCDLMEPFRPFADRMVFINRFRAFDWEYRKELIALPQTYCRYDGKKMKLLNAVEAFVTDALKAMEDETHTIKEVSFCRTDAV